jgi:hypothetical protein
VPVLKAPLVLLARLDPLDPKARLDLKALKARLDPLDPKALPGPLALPLKVVL